MELIAYLTVTLYALTAACGLFSLVSIVAWLMYVPLVVRVFSQTPWLFAETSTPVDGGEEVSFETADGLTLRGTYLFTPAEHRRGAILYCHELTADRWAATRYVQDLLDRGYDVLTFDFRNHGTSDRMPRYQPMPWVTRFEVEDVLAAVSYLCSRDDADRQGVGVFGISRGGTAALCAAAEEPRIRAVVTDGAFPLEEMQLHYMRRYMQIYLRYSWLLSKLPDWVLFSFCRWGRYIVGAKQHCRFVHVTQTVKRIRQPVFMIHGEKDNYIPIEVVLMLRNAISRRTRVWLVSNAKHNRAFDMATDLYQRRTGRFFQTHLPGIWQRAPLQRQDRAAR